MAYQALASGGMAAVPERLRQAVDLLDPRPGERILEVGCGPGVAAALVCERLGPGTMLATDRSPTAVERTARRNADHVTSGRLAVEQVALADLAAPPVPFDKAFAVNVNMFWTSPAVLELAALGRALRPGGRLFLFYESAGPTAATRVVDAVTGALGGAGFADLALRSADATFAVTGLAPTPAPAPSR